jgi:hypothetical protein
MRETCEGGHAESNKNLLLWEITNHHLPRSAATHRQFETDNRQLLLISGEILYSIPVRSETRTKLSTGFSSNRSGVADDITTP